MARVSARAVRVMTEMTEGFVPHPRRALCKMTQMTNSTFFHKVPLKEVLEKSLWKKVVSVISVILSLSNDRR